MEFLSPAQAEGDKRVSIIWLASPLTEGGVFMYGIYGRISLIPRERSGSVVECLT